VLLACHARETARNVRRSPQRSERGGIEEARSSKRRDGDKFDLTPAGDNVCNTDHYVQKLQAMLQLRLCSGPASETALLFLTMFSAGCDQHGGEPFSVKVRVENDQGEAVEGATIGVRPCYAPPGGGLELPGCSSDSTNKTGWAKSAGAERFFFNQFGVVDGAISADEPQSYGPGTSVAPERKNAFRLAAAHMGRSESIVGKTRQRSGRRDRSIRSFRKV